MTDLGFIQPKFIPQVCIKLVNGKAVLIIAKVVDENCKSR